jgi:hypothetical protein
LTACDQIVQFYLYFSEVHWHLPHFVIYLDGAKYAEEALASHLSLLVLKAVIPQASQNILSGALQVQVKQDYL